MVSIDGFGGGFDRLIKVIVASFINKLRFKDYLFNKLESLIYSVYLYYVDISLRMGVKVL